MPSFTLAREFGGSFSLCFENDEGIAVDFSSVSTVNLVAKDGEENEIFAKSLASGIAIESATNGVLSVSVLPEDLAEVDLDSLLYWTIVATFNSGTPVSMSGTLLVVEHAQEYLYVTAQEVRQEGLVHPSFSNKKILAMIRAMQQFVERATRQWFYPRKLELYADGTDSDALFFGVPIISIAELRINDDTQPLDKQYYKVYDRKMLNGRHNPCIKLIDTRFYEADIYTAPMRDGRMIFRHGRQNQYIRGVFGCVEPDGSTPALIKRAVLKLVIEKLARPLYVDPTQGLPPEPPPLISGILREEWTDGHRLKYAQSGGDLRVRAPGLAGFTDDQEVLRILHLYKAPIGIATPANPSYR